MPFAPRAKKVLELALTEALTLGHNYIGTEHILLGLVRENEGVASHILRELGADAGTIRMQAVMLLQSAASPPAPGPTSSRVDLRGITEVAGSREGVSASLATIIEELKRSPSGERQISRRRARRLVEDAIHRHDPDAQATLGAEAWDAMLVQVLDANPDVEPAAPADADDPR